MSNPSRNDVNSMADLIRAMGNPLDALGDLDQPAAPVRMPAFSKPGDIDPHTGLPIEVDDMMGSDDIPAYMAESMEVGRAPRVPISSEENSAMAKILMAFHESGGDRLVNADETIEYTKNRIIEDSQHMPELKRALQTEITDGGVRIGGWKIISEGSQKTASRYHVVSAESGQQIAKNLYLFEAAEALVDHLNDGCMINNMKVQNILRLEMEYAKHIEDAITHKHACSRAIDRGDDDRLEVAKIRFNESKTKAVAAKHKLLENLGSK